MKFLIILLIVLLLSCKNKSHKLIIDDKTEYPKYFHFKNNGNKDLNLREWNIILGEDNHEYLTNNGGSSFVLIHYPDCKKCLRNNKIK